MEAEPHGSICSPDSWHLEIELLMTRFPILHTSAASVALETASSGSQYRTFNAATMTKGKVHLLDYVAGNIRSLVNAIEKCGWEVEWIRKPEDVEKAEVGDCFVNFGS